jgi:peptidoglycan/xylan/chitin deacetylase (PgdA/CDA1 family)
VHRFSIKDLAFFVAIVTVLSGCVSKPNVPNKPDNTAAVVAPPESVLPPEPVYDATAFAPLHPRALSSRVTVLMFHDVVTSRGKGGVYFDSTVDEFNEILDYFEDQGAHYLSLRDLHEHLVTGKPVPERSVVLTFDDNYLGFYENAWPILKAKNIPSGMFVHTDFVGNTSGSHPKMNWDQLKELDATGLVEIGGHTCSHPGDLKSLPEDVQERELTKSKALLEDQLGHPVPFLAYPVGSADAKTIALTKSAGYTMAFTMKNGPAEESPGVLEIQRTIQTKYKQAFEQSLEQAKSVPAAVITTDINNAPITLTTGEFDDISLVFVSGGIPMSVRDPDGGRKSVGAYVEKHGGKAGMNGTFFVNAALRGTDNAMIGPFRSQNEGKFFDDRDARRLEKLVGRPLIAWNEKQISVAPFSAEALNTEDGVRQLQPDFTDCFLAGAWIVHEGVARSRSEISTAAASDFNDPRKRAFFGWKADGTLVYGATQNVITTSAMARGAAAAGLQEAFLMDSGFSTSVVFNGKIMATGHSSESLPSREVPHALVIQGELGASLDADTQKAFDEAKSSTEVMGNREEDASTKTKKRRRSRRR